MAGGVTFLLLTFTNAEPWTSESFRWTCERLRKGIALVAVVGNIVKDQWNISNLIIGLLAAIGFFIWGYVIDGGSDND